jgi:hypothetical protein
MGLEKVNVGNSLAGCPPTRWVGESGVISSGCSSSSFSLAHQLIEL